MLPLWRRDPEVQPEIDYVVFGEGELTIAELCRMSEQWTGKSPNQGLGLSHC